MTGEITGGLVYVVVVGGALVFGVWLAVRLFKALGKYLEK